MTYNLTFRLQTVVMLTMRAELKPLGGGVDPSHKARDQIINIADSNEEVQDGERFDGIRTFRML